MPEGLVDTLTDEELTSLVRFLSELGRTPSSQFPGAGWLGDGRSCFPQKKVLEEFSEPVTDNPPWMIRRLPGNPHTAPSRGCCL